MKSTSSGIALYGNPAKMRGMTTIGLIILVLFIGMFAYAGIQLAPVYLNYMKVAGVVEGIKEEFDGQNPTVGNMRRSIERRFSIENVSVITSKDIKITPDSGGFLVDATYNHITPYVANVSFSVHFEKQAVVRR